MKTECTYVMNIFFLLIGAEHFIIMSSDQVMERLVGSFDCKQGAVRAVRFNGEYEH